MTTVDEIEGAIEKLDPRELDKLRAWFEEFQSRHFDAKIERDVRNGRLDGLAEQALADFRIGGAKEL